MWIIGLTGSIGAGKSTAAEVFRREGVPLHCADTFIHFLLENDQEIKSAVHSLWPGALVNGRVDRSLLGDLVLYSPQELKKLEDLLYPKLAAEQKRFLCESQKANAPIVVLDIPLLFEVGLDSYCDFVLLVSAPLSMRKLRVMERLGMTAKKFNAIERLQMTDKEKQKRAHIVLYTGRDKRNGVKTILEFLSVLSENPSPQWQGKWPKNLKRKAL